MVFATSEPLRGVLSAPKSSLRRGAAGPDDQRAAARMVMSRRWTVAVPHGGALWDGSWALMPGGCSVALLDAVDGRAPDTE